MSTNTLQSEQLKIVIVGHVDHGKSTLVGVCFTTLARCLGQVRKDQVGLRTARDAV